MTDAAGDRPDVLRLERSLPAPPGEVFHAWTDVDHLKSWMCPGNGVVSSADADVRVGGQFRLILRYDHREYEERGTFTTLEPPRRLAFTWFSAATLGRETVVTVELMPAGDDTHLVLTHSRLPGPDARRRHLESWTSIVDKLAARLAT